MTGIGRNNPEYNCMMSLIAGSTAKFLNGTTGAARCADRCRILKSTTDNFAVSQAMTTKRI